jgi:hypothetical protein
MDMRSSGFVRDWLPVLFGFALGFAGVWECQALDIRTYFVSASTGYGVEECLDDGGECGEMVANAWCDAQGQGVALEFGRSEVDPASASDASWPAPKRYYVQCRATDPR